MVRAINCCAELLYRSLSEGDAKAGGGEGGKQQNKSLRSLPHTSAVTLCLSSAQWWHTEYIYTLSKTGHQHKLHLFLLFVCKALPSWSPESTQEEKIYKKTPITNFAPSWDSFHLLRCPSRGQCETSPQMKTETREPSPQQQAAKPTLAWICAGRGNPSNTHCVASLSPFPGTTVAKHRLHTVTLAGSQWSRAPLLTAMYQPGNHKDQKQNSPRDFAFF